MTQIATVKELLKNGRAEILVCRQSACGHNCADCFGCDTEGSARVTVVAENGAGARPGDTVLVESGSGRVLGLAAAVYLVPLLFLFVGASVAIGPLGLGEGTGMLIGLLCMALGFLADRLLDRRVRTARPVKMRITEVVETCSDT